MKQYVESNPKTRQLFFLALILIGAFALFVDRMEQILPAIDSDTTVAIDQVLDRSLFATVLATVFYGLFSFVAIHYVRRTVQSKQWPPVGMSVPFRMPVKEIKRPWVAWTYLAVLLCIFLTQIFITWYAYGEQREYFRELKQLIDESPNKSPKPTL